MFVKMKNIKNFAVALCAVLLSIILGYTILAWTEPGATPPAGNVVAPLNASATAQTKSGGLNFLDKVGIGTASPAKTLEVNGDTKSSRFCLGSGANEKCCSYWAQCFCPPKTCANLGATCGNPSDGCGATLNCGTCASGYDCSNGTCVAQGGGGGGGSTDECTYNGYFDSWCSYNTCQTCTHCESFWDPQFGAGTRCHTDTSCSTTSWCP